MYSYVARQPIIDENQNVIAYELLFRDGESNHFPDIDPNQATSNILTNNHLTLGVEEITAGLSAYINFHADTLIRKFPSFLDPQNIVVEILEDVPISDELLTACETLKSQGFTLALDDHDFDPKWDKFLPYADIIKVDVLSLSLIEISKYVNRIKPFNKILLAEKVETLQQFEQLKLLGFTLFQGYFFAKPEMLKRRKINTVKSNMLALIQQASHAQLNFAAISDIFSADVGLTYKLLRFINSPVYGRSQDITSLKHALTYIGEVELKKFIALLALSDLAAAKPSEIMRLSLYRAKFCEFIANYRKDLENPPKAFLTGMLSLIDGVLDQDIKDVVEILPIDNEIKAALLGQQNDLSKYIRLAVSAEQGDWQQAENLANELSLEPLIYAKCNLEALKWADEMLANHQAD